MGKTMLALECYSCNNVMSVTQCKPPNFVLSLSPHHMLKFLSSSL